MNEANIAALTAFVAKIATIRSTGSGWIVVGDEPFLGESNRVVKIDALAREAKELLALLPPCVVTEQTMHDLLVKPHEWADNKCFPVGTGATTSFPSIKRDKPPDNEDAAEIMAAIAEKKRTK